MSQTNDTTPSMTTNNHPNYVGNMSLCTARLQGFLRSRKQSVDLPFTRESVLAGVPELNVANNALVMESFSKNDLLTLLEQFMSYHLDVGVRAVKDKVPSYANTAKHFADILNITHTKKDGTVVPAFWATVGNMRWSMRQASKAQKREEAVASGKAYFVTGVLNKDGTPRVFTTEKKALSASARTYAKEAWAEANAINTKEARAEVKALPEVVANVYSQGQSVGKVDQKPVNKFTMDMVMSMHHTKIIRLARANGCKGNTKAEALHFILDNFAKLDFTSL